MYHPTTRVLAVLALLQSHGRMTGAEMARRLEVNIRTLRRYITMLQDVGIPIIAERGRNGSYELTAGYKLPPMMFTNDEAMALSIGLLTARHLGLTETIRAIESAQAKLEQVMPLALKQQVRALTETITFDLNMLPMESPGKVLLTMSSAAQLQRRVHMRYRSRQNDETERDFDPYGLAYRKGCWYVVGYCELRQGLRSFRLDRVEQVELTDISFHRPEHFDILSYVVKTLATLPRQFSFEVLLKTDLTTAQNEAFDMLGVLEPCEGGVLLRGSADDLDWLARTLARFSFESVIHAPEDLRNALLRLAESLRTLAERR
ncbi:MAG TPA: YafY family protein [Phototrophicaceae bacterium]|jgi:predicted DNA-binding transcriptional regulator YafY|nr:YafY family protein [Phototrophicaceae bacterium]